MTRKDILEAVKRFVGVLDEQSHIEDREGALRAALDRLALAYHFAAVPFDQTKHPDAPRADYWSLRECIAPLFPALGLYNEALHIVDKVGESELSIGDAIDDLTDIAMDLHSVLFRWENTSEEDALWHFRFGFETHWGLHLRSLQLYLHQRAF
ncbi:DUF5063 domain-containing protein [Myxococcus virescens]|uniref:DUF5063 domain-containing protein n=1 Tax=Myxococcus virescens TaxID=83456 RepID=A0A511H7I5_9BACT|nr:DUF5063 domain-containing protein [Myxococcus virescens]GEL69463.1 hypothetical protein MVI01_12470 [Myxococcus virescens]SDE39112.1 protein of unknown function [Myxococcus virescens]